MEVDILKGGSRTPEFLAMNPNGRIPVLRLDDGTCLAESNAILWYLAEGSSFLPADRLARALTLQWMFFEQYSHEPNVAVARHWLRHVEMSEAQRAQLPAFAVAPDARRREWSGLAGTRRRSANEISPSCRRFHGEGATIPPRARRGAGVAERG